MATTDLIETTSTGVARAWRSVAEELEAGSELPPRLREIVRLTVLRRAPEAFAAGVDAARAVGVDAALVEAIEAEDWTDEAFDETERAVFRYVLLFDAGHGIGSKVMDGVRERLSRSQLAEVAMWAVHAGGTGRLELGTGGGGG